MQGAMETIMQHAQGEGRIASRQRNKLNLGKPNWMCIGGLGNGLLLTTTHVESVAGLRSNVWASHIKPTHAAILHFEVACFPLRRTLPLRCDRRRCSLQRLRMQASHGIMFSTNVMSANFILIFASGEVS